MDKQPHELKFALSDLIALLKRHKKTVAFSIFLGALLCGLLAVTRPTVYLMQSTFRDKGKTQANIHSSLTDLFFSQTPYDSQAISTMRSHRMLSQVANALDLQGKVGEAKERYPDLENAQDNLLSEWAYWNNAQAPILPDLSSPLTITDVKYEGEITKFFSIEFIDNLHYAVFDGSEKIAEGRLGEPFKRDYFSFTLLPNTENEFAPDSRYIVTLFPMSNVTKYLAGLLVIESDRDDKSLLKLQFRHRDRHLGVKFLNTLMAAYQGHLEKQHEQDANAQLSYLEKRQKEVSSELQKLMKNHVENVSEEMANSGFTSLQKEMEFLASNLASNQQKLTELELETKRLKNIDPDCCIHYDGTRGDSGVINHLLQEMRVLKTQADNLELVAEATNTTPKERKETLEKNLKNLEKIDRCLKECDALATALKKENKDPLSAKLLENSEFPIASWIATYKAKEKAVQFATAMTKVQLQAEFDQFKGQFLTYLDTFDRLLKIKRASLQHQIDAKQVHQEFKGLTLDASRALHIAYVKELNDLQSEEKQHRFVVEQLSMPNFELSSLTALLKDPISHERIAKTTQLLILIQDQVNHTQKERDRYQEDLNLQKEFLTAHILQMADLLKLKTEVLQEKIEMLQLLTLDLTYQQIALLKKNVADLIHNRVGYLDQEVALLTGHQKELHQRMAKIPLKWADEQFLNQNLSLNQRFLENLASMVEGKNITKNLEMVQSEPLDYAIAPINPKPPRLAFYSLIGAVLGFGAITSLLFTRTLIKGIPASFDNLHLANFHVSGRVSHHHGDEVSATPPFIDTDLDALRRLIAFFEKAPLPESHAKSILIVQGRGPDYSNTLAKLLSKKGLKTLKLNLAFKAPSKNQELQPGLLQYLESNQQDPAIEHLDGFDYIASGGASRYSEELLRSPRFIQLLEKLKSEYDWILAVSPTKLPSAEAENLSHLFDGTVLTITKESLQEILAFTKALTPEKTKSLTLMLSSRT